MRRFAVINYKGGTGKTSLTVNLSHGLALKGYKVLIIDSDPQGSAGHHLGASFQKTLYDCLILNEDPFNCLIEVRPNLDIICSNERLFPAAMKLANVKKREYKLLNMMNNVRHYDYIFVDCAPSMNLLNQNALLFSDELLLPVSMEYLSLIGVKQLLKNVKIINKMFNKRLDIKKVIPTFYDKRNKKSKVILESLKRVFPSTLFEPIRTSISLSEAPANKMTIFEYDPNSGAAQDYFNLVEAIENG